MDGFFTRNFKVLRIHVQSVSVYLFFNPFLHSKGPERSVPALRHPPMAFDEDSRILLALKFFMGLEQTKLGNFR